MRKSQQSVTYDKLQTITEIADTENIIKIVEDKQTKNIVVSVGYYDANVSLIGEQSYQKGKDNYDLLMSADPDFAPGKPENEYREIDLWYIIDLIRAAH